MTEYRSSHAYCLKNQEGFSLIELVTVIILMGILTSIAIANYISLSNEAKSATCRANQVSLESAQRIYYSNHYIEGNPGYAGSMDELIPYLTRVTPPKCPDEQGQLQLLPGGLVTCTIDSHKRR